MNQCRCTIVPGESNLKRLLPNGGHHNDKTKCDSERLFTNAQGSSVHFLFIFLALSLQLAISNTELSYLTLFYIVINILRKKTERTYE